MERYKQQQEHKKQLEDMMWDASESRKYAYYMRKELREGELHPVHAPIGYEINECIKTNKSIIRSMKGEIKHWKKIRKMKNRYYRRERLEQMFKIKIPKVKIKIKIER